MIKRILDFHIQLSPKKRRIISVILIIFIAMGTTYSLLLFILPYIVANTKFLNMTISEAIASVAIIVTVTIAATNLIVASLKKRYESKKQLALSIDVSNNKVIITSTIENTGKERITPKSFYLFINETPCAKLNFFVSMKKAQKAPVVVAAASLRTYVIEPTALYGLSPCFCQAYCL